MRRPLVIYDFATAPFWISLYMREIFFFLFYQCALLDSGVLGHGGHRPPGQHHHRPQDLPGGHVRIRLRLRVRTQHCKQTCAFHQEFHQPGRKAQDQTISLTENSPFSVSLDVWSFANWCFFKRTLEGSFRFYLYNLTDTE
jgi:hypothetical protein